MSQDVHLPTQIRTHEGDSLVPDQRQGSSKPRRVALRKRRTSDLAVRTGIGVAFSAILFVIFAHLVNLGSAFQRLEHLNIILALLSGLVFLSAYAVRALRWRCFLEPERPSAPQVVGIYQVANLVNFLLPVRGGELLKAILLQRLRGTLISRSLPTIVMDKVMDLAPAIGLFVVLPFLPIRLSGSLWALLLMVLVVLVGGALFLGVAAWRRTVALALLAWIMGWLPRVVRQRLEPFAMRFVDALLGLVARPRLLLIASGYTAVAVCLDALYCFLAFLAVGTNVSFAVVLFGYTLFNLTYILPIQPPGQIGSNELIGLLIFAGLFHMTPTAVATMFLFAHPWSAIIMGVAGAISLSAMGLSLRSTIVLTREPERVVQS